jgi:protein PhnA
MPDDDYVYDEDSGEWLPASELAAKQAAAREGEAVEVRDAVGNLLADGDQVTLIKDLTVKGAGRTLKQGTLIKSIRLTGGQPGNRLPLRRHQGPGAARGVRAQAVGTARWNRSASSSMPMPAR